MLQLYAICKIYNLLPTWDRAKHAMPIERYCPVLLVLLCHAHHLFQTPLLAEPANIQAKNLNFFADKQR